MRTEWAYCLRNRYFMIGSGLLTIGFILYTYLYFKGLTITILDYQMAGEVYTPFSLYPSRTLSALHFWFGTSAPSRLPERTFGFYDNAFSCLLIPIFLALLNLDTYLQDVKGNVKNIRISKSGKGRYYFAKLFSVFLVSFLIIYALQLLQFGIGWAVDRSTHPLLISTPIQAADMFVVIGIAARIALFYAIIVAFSFSISLYLERIPAAVYALPLVVTIAASMFIQPMPFNLAFYYSNLNQDAMQPFYGFICILTGGCFLLVLKKVIRRDQLE